MRRFLKAEELKGSFSEGLPVGKSADEMSSVRYSSSLRLAGNCTVWRDFDGVFGEEKNAKRDVELGALGVEDVLLPESVLESVGRFFNFAAGRSGDAPREGLEGVELSCSMIGIPTATGAEEPVNHDASPPLDRFSTFMTPSLSPVSVGTKSSPCISFRFSGLLFLRSGDFDFVPGERNDGSKAVRFLWCPLGCLVCSSQTGMLFALSVRATGGGEEISRSGKLSPSKSLL